MKKIPMQCLLAVAGLAICASASAQIKLVNKDSKAHDVLIKCSSSADSSIAGSSTRDIGKGPCTVTVKSTKSSKSAAGKGELTIKDGKFN